MRSTSLVQAVLLSLDLTRVTREEATLLQNGSKVGVEGKERTGQTMEDCSRLPCDSTTANVDIDVKLTVGACSLQRLVNHHALNLVGDVLIKRTTVYYKST